MRVTPCVISRTPCFWSAHTRAQATLAITAVTYGAHTGSSTPDSTIGHTKKMATGLLTPPLTSIATITSARSTTTISAVRVRVATRRSSTKKGTVAAAATPSAMSSRVESMVWSSICTHNTALSTASVNSTRRYITSCSCLRRSIISVPETLVRYSMPGLGLRCQRVPALARPGRKEVSRVRATARRVRPRARPGRGSRGGRAAGRLRRAARRPSGHHRSRPAALAAALLGRRPRAARPRPGASQGRRRPRTVRLLGGVVRPAPARRRRAGPRPLARRQGVPARSTSPNATTRR